MTHQFKSLTEMHAAGFAVEEYSFDSPHWRMPDGSSVRTFEIPCEQNHAPDLRLARLEVVEANRIKK